MRPLSDLGKRIMVLGPSNAGKSTLAVALSKKLDLPVIHLDQLQHLPHTNWEPRTESEFAALHDDAIQGDQWVMEGNYTRLMPKRFERATGVVLISSNKWLRLGRYLRRTFTHPSRRAGQLEGGQDHLKWEMIQWILFKPPRNTKRYKSMIEQVPIPSVQCDTAQDLNVLYEGWKLQRPQT